MDFDVGYDLRENLYCEEPEKIWWASVEYDQYGNLALGLGTTPWDALKACIEDIEISKRFNALFAHCVERTEKNASFLALPEERFVENLFGTKQK